MPACQDLLVVVYLNENSCILLISEDRHIRILFLQFLSTVHILQQLITYFYTQLAVTQGQSLCFWSPQKKAIVTTMPSTLMGAMDMKSLQKVFVTSHALRKQIKINEDIVFAHCLAILVHYTFLKQPWTVLPYGRTP